jgi:hypothetical protein
MGNPNNATVVFTIILLLILVMLIIYVSSSKNNNNSNNKHYINIQIKNKTHHNFDIFDKDDKGNEKKIGNIESYFKNNILRGESNTSNSLFNSNFNIIDYSTQMKKNSKSNKQHNIRISKSNTVSLKSSDIQGANGNNQSIKLNYDISKLKNHLNRLYIIYDGIKTDDDMITTLFKNESYHPVLFYRIIHDANGIKRIPKLFLNYGQEKHHKETYKSKWGVSYLMGFDSKPITTFDLISNGIIFNKEGHISFIMNQ